METSAAKRRKLDHQSSSATAGGRKSATAASAFAEAADDLLGDVRVDYAKAFEGADESLRGFKETIESIESHGPALVWI